MSQENIIQLDAKIKPLQDSTGGAVIGGAFELVANAQVHFYALARFQNGSGGSMELHLDDLTHGTTMHVANVEINGSGNYVATSLYLKPGAYRWSSRLVLRPGGTMSNPTQSGFVKVITNSVTLEVAGGGNNFCIISGPPGKEANARGRYLALLGVSGHTATMTARVSSKDLATTSVIDTIDVTLTGTGHQEVTTSVLSFYLHDLHLYEVRIHHFTNGVRTNGMYLIVTV